MTTSITPPSARRLNDDERKAYMDTLKVFMLSDTEKGIQEGLNYLVAL